MGELKDKTDLIERELDMDKRLLGFPPPMREVDAVPEALDLRKRIGGVLDGYSDEEIRTLIDEALKVKKEAWGHCPGCRKKVKIEVLDAKAVIAAIGELSNQAKGRPGTAEPERDTAVTFENKVVLVAEEAG